MALIDIKRLFNLSIADNVLFGFIIVELGSVAF